MSSSSATINGQYTSVSFTCNAPASAGTSTVSPPYCWRFRPETTPFRSVTTPTRRPSRLRVWTLALSGADPAWPSRGHTTTGAPPQTGISLVHRGDAEGAEEARRTTPRLRGLGSFRPARYPDGSGLVPPGGQTSRPKPQRPAAPSRRVRRVRRLQTLPPQRSHGLCDLALGLLFSAFPPR